MFSQKARHFEFTERQMATPKLGSKQCKQSQEQQIVIREHKNNLILV